ncbi:MAG TPA: S-methyl-5'-thioadenosine phosphorylase [Bacillota bacterium]|nr:S-methyl-5'-thioadenosine phosphorylase [Bacillota bacterium]
MKDQVKLAIIGGSGFYQPGILTEVEETPIKTGYGPVTMLIGKLAETKVAFLARHGQEHDALPHQVNYRANLAALKILGATGIIATAAVGSLRKNLPPGSLVIVDQFLDFTKQRSLTFYEKGDPHAHQDLTYPYCDGLREVLQQAAVLCEYQAKDSGCYVCTEGPRYETAAEIKMFQMLGGDVVGMTGVPEVVLARELGICYANISVVTNWAAGISPRPLSHEEVIQTMNENQERLRQLITKALLMITGEFSCNCNRNL